MDLIEHEKVDYLRSIGFHIPHDRDAWIKCDNDRTPLLDAMDVQTHDFDWLKGQAARLGAIPLPQH
jgi:hypothetical protein